MSKAQDPSRTGWDPGVAMSCEGLSELIGEGCDVSAARAGDRGHLALLSWGALGIV